MSLNEEMWLQRQLQYAIDKENECEKLKQEIEKLKEEIKKLTAERDTAYGFGSNLGKPPWMI